MGSIDPTQKMKRQKSKSQKKKDVTPPELEETGREVLSGLITPIEKLIDDLFIKRAKEICAAIVWVMEGCQKDNNKARQLLEYKAGETIYNDILKEPFDIQLKKLTEYQARCFWEFNGAMEHNCKERMDDDYYDAKRYLGYFIADSLIEACRVSDLCPQEYYAVIKEEQLEYLRSISVEEFLRIRAYFHWYHSSNFIADDDTDRMDKDYYYVMECTQNTMWNCKGYNTGTFIGNKEIIESLENSLVYGESELEKIKKAKTNSCNRHKYYKHKDIDDYVDLFYSVMGKAVKKKEVLKVDVLKLLDVMYKNNHIPNMLEFFSRCFLSTYVDDFEHSTVRAKNKQSCLCVPRHM